MDTRLDIHAYRTGYHADDYFNTLKETLVRDNYNNRIHWQVFPRSDCMLAGMEILKKTKLLDECIGYYENYDNAVYNYGLFRKYNPYIEMTKPEENNFNNIKRTLSEGWINKRDKVLIYIREDGSEVKKNTPIMGIIGNPKYFCHLETPILGILSDCSTVATSCYEIRKSIVGFPEENSRPMFFPARFANPLRQQVDGYGGYVAGFQKFSTPANREFFIDDEETSVGRTTPHLLIGCYNGNTSKAIEMLDESGVLKDDEPRIVLVDWDNNCINTSLEVVMNFIKRFVLQNKNNEKFSHYVQYLSGIGTTNNSYLLRNIFNNLIPEVIGIGKGKLYGVRFDTSGSLIDKTLDTAIQNDESFDDLKGVCPKLVETAKRKFNSLDLNNLKIIVSGGFNKSKIERFKKEEIEFDGVGIGQSIYDYPKVSFTADISLLDGKHCSKVGRRHMDWSELYLL